MVKYVLIFLFWAFFLFRYGVTLNRGWNFGRTKSLEWITSVTIGCFAIVFIYEPLRVLLVSFINTFILSSSPPKSEKVEFEVPVESEIERLRQRADQLFVMLRKSLNEPMEQSEQERRSIIMKRERKLRKILIEILIFSIFLLTLTVLVVQSRHPMSFYSSKNIEDFFVNGKFTQDSFNEINSNNDLKFYLEQIFIPRIHEGKDEKGQKITDGNGWISGKFLRILGVSRLIQSRVMFSKCKFKFCSPGFSKSAEESRDFSVQWENSAPGKFDKKYWRVVQPWKFQSSFDLKRKSHFGYSGGGYSSQLGRTANNSFKVFDFLNQNNWIDRRSKAIIIEFTIYSVDSKIFNVVKLVLERTPFGNLIPSHSIITANFLNDFTDWNFLSPVVAFFVILVVLTVKLGLTLHSKKTWKNIWIITDIFIVLLSITFITLSISRNYYVRTLVKKLEASANNQFVSFNLAAFHDFTSIIVSGFLVAVTTVRLWKILDISPVFRSFNLTLIASAVPLVSALIFIGIVLLAFTSIVCLVNGSQAEIYSTFLKTFLALTANSLGFNRGNQFNDLIHGSKFLGFLITASMMLFINIFLLNLLVTIVFIYIAKVKEEMKKELRKEMTVCGYIERKWRKVRGKPVKNDLKFFHRKYTTKRADHIKTTIDAQLDFIAKYYEMN